MTSDAEGCLLAEAWLDQHGSVDLDPVQGEWWMAHRAECAECQQRPAWQWPADTLVPHLSPATVRQLQTSRTPGPTDEPPDGPARALMWARAHLSACPACQLTQMWQNDTPDPELSPPSTGLRAEPLLVDLAGPPALLRWSVDQQTSIELHLRKRGSRLSYRVESPLAGALIFDAGDPVIARSVSAGQSQGIVTSARTRWRVSMLLDGPSLPSVVHERVAQAQALRVLEGSVQQVVHRTRRWMLGGAAAAVVLIGAGLVWWSRRQTSGPHAPSTGPRAKGVGSFTLRIRGAKGPRPYGDGRVRPGEQLGVAYRGPWTQGSQLTLLLVDAQNTFKLSQPSDKPLAVVEAPTGREQWRLVARVSAAPLTRIEWITLLEQLKSGATPEGEVQIWSLTVVDE